MDSYEQVRNGAFPAGEWKAAKFCGPNGGNCVEVNLAGRGGAGIRDSKSAPGPVLAFGPGGWRRFLDAAKTGGVAVQGSSDD